MIQLTNVYFVWGWEQHTIYVWYVGEQMLSIWKRVVWTTSIFSRNTHFQERQLPQPYLCFYKWLCENLSAIRRNWNKNDLKSILIQHASLSQSYSASQTIEGYYLLRFTPCFYIFVLSLFQFFKLHVSLCKWTYSAPFCYIFMNICFSYFLCSSFTFCVFFTYSRSLDPRWRLKILCGLYVQDHISIINKAKIVSWKIKIWINFYPHYFCL